MLRAARQMFVDARRRCGLFSVATSYPKQSFNGVQLMPETRSIFVRAALAYALLSCLTFAAFAQEQQATPQSAATTQENPADETTATKSFERLEWRNIGPANMGGRIADIEGVPGNPNVVYVATASGGLFRTTNGGMKWTPVFERQGSISIGDIALEPGNPDVIWLGAGES